MSTYKTEGIIIKRNNFGEASLILDIYTKDYGKIEAVARGARKAKGKLKGHLELFLLTDLVLANGRSIDTITSIAAAESFLNLRNNLEFSFGAYYISELIDKVIMEKGHKDEWIFYLLKKSLLFLDRLANDKKFLFVENIEDLSLRGDSRSNPSTMRAELNGGIATSFRIFEKCGTSRNDNFQAISNCLILLFQINLLNLIGFSPTLSKCVFCSKPLIVGGNHFSFELGGIIGKECAFNDPNAILVSDNAIKLLRLFQFNGARGLKKYKSFLNKCFDLAGKLKVDQKLVSDCIFLMNKFIEFNIEKKVRGVDFIYK